MSEVSRADTLVSVLIPAFNAELTIARAVNSALAQDYDPLEIIVVDDASTDATAERVREIDDARVRIIALNEHGGAAKARNTGIRAARGGLIAFLDADDEWFERKLAPQVKLLNSDAALEFVACGAHEIDADGTDLGPLYGGAIPQAGNEAWHGLLSANTIATPTVVARRAALLAVGGFDETLRIGEDQDMWLKLSMHGGLGYIDEILVTVHATPGSLSSRGYTDDAAFTFPMILRHIETKRGALSAREINRITGARLAHLGRAAYTQAYWFEGLGLLTRAILRGHRPVDQLAFLVRSSPPLRLIKRLCRPRVG